MTLVAGQALLQCAAQRILARYLEREGMNEVEQTCRWPNVSLHAGIDLTYRFAGRTMSVKVKPDAYFGRDASKIRDRALAFYRPEGDNYAFEAISNAATREPGWMFNSTADELHYYLLAIDMPEEDIGALMDEPDDAFFSELKVDRDELHVLPMRPVQQWFVAHFEEFTPRPVVVGGHSAWYRIIPRETLESSVPGVRVVGSVFARVAG